jgi:cation-transporting ATPase 13A1
MQVSTFLINYQGRPFREALTENRPLYLSLVSLFGIAVFGAAQVFPDLNAWVELVPLESDFSDILVKSILLDFGLAYGVEYVTRVLFSDNRPPLSLGLDDHEWEELGRTRRQQMVPPFANHAVMVDRDGEVVLPGRKLQLK